MRRKKLFGRKILSFLLAFVLLFSQSNLVAFAEGAADEDSEIEEENPVGADYGIWTWPVEGQSPMSHINQYYSSGHKAIDIGGAEGTWIIAAKDGVVGDIVNDCSHIGVAAGVCKHGAYTNGGNQVYINHDDGTHSNYCHMIKGSIIVSPGQRVSAGQKIGKMGMSGQATGVHLHFGVSAGGNRYWAGTIIDPGSLSYSGSGTPPQAYTVTNTGVTNVAASSARINASVSPMAYVSEMGFYLGTSPDNMERHIENYTGNSLSIWYDLGTGKWTGALSPNTTYYYRIYIVVGGVEYSSNLDSFATADPTETILKDAGVSNLTKTSATITAMLPEMKYCTEDGFYLGTSTHNMTRTPEAGGGNTLKVWFDLGTGKWTQPLQKGTTYYYKLYVVTEGVEYCTALKTFTTLGDNTKPNISNVYYTNLTPNGYTVVCEASDNVGIERVAFPTWTEADGQDDLDPDWRNSTRGTVTTEGTYVFNVSISDHNNEKGIYYTSVYAFDADGNYSCVNLTILIPEYVSSITLSKTSLTLNTGESETLTATVHHSTATVKDVTWSSSNENVATVNEGTVKAVGSGKAVITVTAVDPGGVSATCEVTVEESKENIEVEKIELTSKELEIKKGGKAVIAANVYPTDATDASVEWTSSDTSVATLTARGTMATISAVSEGVTTITAAATNGIKAECVVTVTKVTGSVIPVTGIKLNYERITLAEGESSALRATVTPFNASNKDIFWTSDDTSVAQVDDSGKITAVTEGTAAILATAADGSGVSASCEVTVKKDYTKNADFTIYVAARGKIDAGAAIREFLEKDQAELVKKYSSSDKKVAAVTKKGIVTGKKAGTSIITAYVKNGKKFEAVGSVEVIVTKPVFDFGNAKLTDMEDSLYLYDYITDLPEDTPVSWSVPKSAAKIAVVSEDYLIPAGKSGSLTVTCIIGEGKYAAKYKAKIKAEMPPYLPGETTVKLNKWKTVTICNVPKGQKVEWMWGSDNADGSIQIRPSGKSCKIKVTNADHEFISLGAKVGDTWYWTDIVVE